MMRNVPWHVKEIRPAVRDSAGEAARRSGLSVGAAFAMIRKDIHELRRQASRPYVEPALLEQRLHDIATQIDALQRSAPSRDGSRGDVEAFVAQVETLLAQNETKLATLQQQIATSAADAISGPAESIRRDVASLKEIQASVDRRTQDTFEAVYDTIERIVDRLAALEEELRGRHAGAQADSSPVEPERGAPAVRTASAADVPAPAAEGPGITAMLRQPAVPDLIAYLPVRLESIKADSDPSPAPATAGSRLMAAARRAGEAMAGAIPTRTQSATIMRPRGRAAVLGVGVLLATLFAVTFALDFYRSPVVVVSEPLPPGTEDRVAMDADLPEDEAIRPAEPPSAQPARQASGQISGDAPPVPGNGSPLPDGSPPVAAPADGVAPAAIPGTAGAVRQGGEASLLMRNVLFPAPASEDPWPPAAADPTGAPLPPAIGSKALIAAAAAGDPGASYEIAIRFAQGRNAAHDYAMAAAWLDRAARAGLAPAQFRLGSMYEKGLGVRRDIAEARRLYVAAAAKGHAKAMHNLAALCAGGIDGVPDYAAAAEWFRKAAAYGVVDSQYNLGILYGRGTGVERDLAESYKWFAVAAKGGDKDAARKRDEVARGLDPKHLESARQAADAFVVMPQPEEATAIGAPAGGWDKVATAATTKSRPFVRPERFPGR